MTRRMEIIAISEYYNIPMRQAAVRRESMTEEELEKICSWWMDRKEA